MFYSDDYLEASALAGEIIKQCGIASFPVNPIILARNAGIKVVTLETFAEFTGLSLEQVASASSDGFSARIDNQYFIAYNPHVTPKARRRWTLIHEYCHIRLGHLDGQQEILPLYLDDLPMESEANELTCCLIAPLPVALMCHIETEQQFAACFGLSRQATIHLYSDYNRYRFMDCPAELGYGDALSNFRSFILSYNRNEYVQKRAPKIDKIDIVGDDMVG